MKLSGSFDELEPLYKKYTKDRVQMFKEAKERNKNNLVTHLREYAVQLINYTLNFCAVYGKTPRSIKGIFFKSSNVQQIAEGIIDEYEEFNEWGHEVSNPKGAKYKTSSCRKLDREEVRKKLEKFHNPKVPKPEKRRKEDIAGPSNISSEELERAKKKQKEEEDKDDIDTQQQMTPQWIRLNALNKDLVPSGVKRMMRKLEWTNVRTNTTFSRKKVTVHFDLCEIWFAHVRAPSTLELFFSISMCKWRGKCGRLSA